MALKNQLLHACQLALEPVLFETVNEDSLTRFHQNLRTQLDLLVEQRQLGSYVIYDVNLASRHPDSFVSLRYTVPETPAEWESISFRIASGSDHNGVQYE